MDKRGRSVAQRSAVIAIALTSVLAACGGDDGSGSGDPLLEEGSNVIPSGTGPGTVPVPPESTVLGIDPAAPGSAGGPAPAGSQQPPVAADSSAP